MAWLLDTNLLSEPTRSQPSAKALNWLQQHQAASYVSTLSLGELWKGIQLLPLSRRAPLEAWLGELLEQFEGRILSVDFVVTKEWGSYTASFLRAGRSVSVVDGLIAATALAHDLTVATRNTADFPGVRTVNPWGR